MKILCKMPLSPYSGYGNDGLGITKTLIARGDDVRLAPTHVQPPWPPSVAQLLEKPLDPPFDVALVHVDPLQMSVTPEVRLTSKLVVGWTMWEWTGFGNLEKDLSAQQALETFHERYRNFDVIACYDEVTKQALESVLPSTTTLVVQQGGYEPDYWLGTPPKDWGSERFGFCMVGQLHARKNPGLAVQAFAELKQEHPEEFEPAELHLKSSSHYLNPVLEQAVPKLRVHNATWPEDVLRTFYSKQHCLLSPSWGEGKNMPALEFMSGGGVVIASDWGGHQQWLSSEYAHPLRVTPMADYEDTQTLRAHASLDHLKELMLHVFRNRAEARQVGDNAAAVVPKMCSWPVVIDKLFKKLGLP